MSATGVPNIFTDEPFIVCPCGSDRLHFDGPTKAACAKCGEPIRIKNMLTGDDARVLPREWLTAQCLCDHPPGCHEHGGACSECSCKKYRYSGNVDS